MKTIPARGFAHHFYMVAVLAMAPVAGEYHQKRERENIGLLLVLLIPYLKRCFTSYHLNLTTAGKE